MNNTRDLKLILEQYDNEKRKIILRNAFFYLKLEKDILKINKLFVIGYILLLFLSLLGLIATAIIKQYYSTFMLFLLGYFIINNLISNIDDFNESKIKINELNLSLNIFKLYFSDEEMNRVEEDTIKEVIKTRKKCLSENKRKKGLNV